MVRDTAHAYAQDKLLPRVTEAFRHEKSDPAIFREMGALGLLGATLPSEYGGAGLNYVCYGLIAREIERVDSGYRSMMSVQSSLVMFPILHLRQRGAAAQVPAEARDRRMDRLLRPDRARPWLRSGQHGDARAQRRRRLQAVRREDVDLQFADRRRVRRLGEDRRRRDPRLHPRKGHEGTVGAEDRGQVQPAHVDHRRDRDGRGVRARGEPAAERRGPEGPVRLPQLRALRHRVGRARRRRILLARGAAVHAGPQAVRPPARGEPARPEEARRHADRDHAGPAGLPAPRADEGRGQRRAGDHVDHEAQFVRQGARHRARPRATCTAATASSTSST